MNTVTIDYYRKRNDVWSLEGTREVENKSLDGILVSPEWPSDLEPLEQGDIAGFMIREGSGMGVRRIDDFSGKR